MLSNLKPLYYTFLNNVRMLEAFPTHLVEDIFCDSVRAYSASCRISEPFVFEPFRRIISKRIGKVIHLDTSITKEKAIEQDVATFKLFSVRNFNFSKFNNDYLIKAAMLSASELGLCKKEKFKLVSIEDSLYSLPSNTAAGFPFYGKRGSSVNISDSKSFVAAFLNSPSIKVLFSNVVTIYHRYSCKLSDDLNSLKVKTRVVWGSPSRIAVLEGVFFNSILDSFLFTCSDTMNLFCAVGKTKGKISKMVSNLRNKRRNIISIDLKSFDSSIPSWMWALFSAVIKQNLDIPKQYVKVFDLIIAYNNYTPYIYRSKYIKITQCGNPSGSKITSLFNNWVNRTIINYAALEFSKGMYSAGDNAFCLGDDVLFSESIFKYSHLVDVYKRFGMTVNSEKSSIHGFNEEAEFAGNFWDAQNEPNQRLPWYISHFCIPGKFYVDSPVPISLLQTYRAISIWSNYANGYAMWNLLIGEDDVVWCDLLDKYLKGEEVYIRYIGRDERMLFDIIPLANIFKYGWRGNQSGNTH